jgi:hypothetical protein
MSRELLADRASRQIEAAARRIRHEPCVTDDSDNQLRQTTQRP